MSNSPIWLIDRIQSEVTTSGQNGHGSDSNEGVLRNPQSFIITGASSNCLMLYQDTRRGWVLLLCRDAVGVFNRRSCLSPIAILMLGFVTKIVPLLYQIDCRPPLWHHRGNKLTNAKLLKIHQCIFISRNRVATERKKGSIEAWDDRQLDNYKQHILVRKRWADIDLEFFPDTNMLVNWV